MKKLLILFVFLCMLLMGCSSKENKEVKELYQIDENTSYMSSEMAYDYNFRLNNHWTRDDNQSLTESDCYVYVNDLNNDKIYVLKNTEANNLEGYQENLECKDIPQYLDSTFNMMNLHVNFDMSESRNDYVDQMKFLIVPGTIDNLYIKAIFFQSEHSIPSIEGSVVPNCIIIEYNENHSNKSINNFVNELIKNIYYE